MQHSSTNTIERPDVRNGSETRLQGRRLLLARVAWVVVTLLILGLNIGAIPRYHAVLQTVCAVPVNCFSDQLTVTDVQETMQPAHVSLWLRSPQRHTEVPRRLEKPTMMEEGF